MESEVTKGAGAENSGERTGYCMRCRAKKPMQDATETRTKNGMLAVMGTCVTCGTRMYKILGSANMPKD